jgi:hypothetical protein
LATYPENSDEEIEFLFQHLTGMPEDPKATMIQLQDFKDGKISSVFNNKKVYEGNTRMEGKSDKERN